MGFNSGLLNQLNEISWEPELLEDRFVVSWEKQNIVHGFLGKKANPADFNNIRLIKQIHSNIIKTIDDENPPENLSEGDGLFTKLKNAKIGVVTADCVPILLKGKSSISCLHGGWKGLHAEIIDRGVDLFLENNENPQNILVAIGPAISPQKFEIGPEILELFEDLLSQKLSQIKLGLLFTKGNSDRWFMDLPLLSSVLLLKKGIQGKNITVIRSCTFSNEDLWYSYRRDGKKAGRITSYISL